MICAETLSFLQELEAIKARVRQMEEEAAKLKQMQSEVDKQMTSPAGSASALNMSYEEKVCYNCPFNPIYHVSVDHQHKLCYC